MTKISYSSLKLKIKDDVKTFDFNGNTIEVLQYLPIEDKYDLISIVTNEAIENGIYNPLKLDMLLHLYIVFLYTNINFTDKQKEDLPKLYNTLKSNLIIDKVLENMDEEEYNTLYEYVLELTENTFKFKKSTAGMISSLITDLPTQANAAMDIVNNFDPNQFKNIIEFVQMANGGNPIK